MDYIDRADQIRALGSPIRQSILNALVVLGPSTPRRIAAHLGSTLDGLYYHLKILEAVGLIDSESTGTSQDEAEQVFGLSHQRKRAVVRYVPSDPDNVEAILKIARSANKLAMSDFELGFRHPGAVCEGPERNLWLFRVCGWMGRTELVRLNELLWQVSDLFMKEKSEDRQELQSCTVVTAPLLQKSLYRKK